MFGKSKRIDISAVGQAMAIIGVPYGMYLNYFYPITKWSPILSFIAILLIPNWGNLKKFYLPSINKVISFIVFFQFVGIAYYAFGYNQTFQLLSFHLFIISLCITVSSLPRDYDFSRLVNYVFYLSIPLVVFGVFFCFFNLVVGEEAWKLRQEIEDYSIEPFTVACGTLYNAMAAVLFLNDRNPRIIARIMIITCLILDLYVMLSCEKRTPLFVFIVACGFYYIKALRNSKKIKSTKAYTLLFFFLLVVLYLTNDSLRNMVDGFFENTYKGVLNLFGNTSVSDYSGSAMERTYTRKMAYNYMDNHFDIVNYVLGNGYFMYWLDNPLLQSYFDMGIFGLLGYVYLVVLFPLSVMRKRCLSTEVIFCVMLSLYGMVSILSAGHPYEPDHYICLVMLSVCYSHKKTIYNI